MISWPDTGSVPRTLPSSAPAASSSRALATVSSSGRRRRARTRAAGSRPPDGDGEVLHVRSVPPDAELDALADRHRVDAARVDVAEVRHEVAQALGVLALRGVAEVELGEPRDAVAAPGGDLVEVGLHARGEVVVDEPVEVLLEQPHDGEREPARHERLPARQHVPAVLDRRDRRGVRRRPPDPELLERLDQAGLGVPRRRGRGVPVGGEVVGSQGVALAHLRQARRRRRPWRRRRARPPRTGRRPSSPRTRPGTRGT